MEYKISIAPHKTQEFLQIIQSLQKLGVVTDLDVFADTTNKKSGERLSLKRGSGRGVITYIADDFNAPLEDFEDYM